MAAIVNARDKLLQAAASRVVPVTLPGNVIVPQDQVEGLPQVVLNSKVIFLRSSAQVFQIPKVGNASPASITLTPVVRNVTGAQVWSIVAGEAALTAGANGTKTLAFADMVSDVVTVRLSIVEDGLTYKDEITIAKLREGSDAINVLLTNENHTLTADTAGKVNSYSGAVAAMKVYIGTADTTASWTFSKVDGTGITSTLVSNVVTITALQDATDASYVDITAARNGYASITRRFSISKSKSGTNGARGAGSYYVTGTAWSDVVASAACPGGPVVNDEVTISNRNPAFIMVKVWNGTGWVAQGTVIDGDLLVSKTVKAGALDVFELSAITGTIGTLRTATTGGRTEIRDNLIALFDTANAPRLKMGNLNLVI